MRDDQDVRHVCFDKLDYIDLTEYLYQLRLTEKQCKKERRGD